jgi:hypothetical protein
MGRLGPYRVLKVLGQGGMGVVFHAEDVRLGRAVALKVMLPDLAQKPDAKERFLREAKATAAIEHDNIVSIYQVDEDRGIPYIAMPLLRGMSLEQWLRRKEAGPEAGAIPVRQVLKLGREIARGLAAAHARGLIHRDIKPANIWLDATAGGRVKVLDFGLARATTGQQNLTQSGMILGTPAYMAPEQASAGGVDCRADLFSLGVVLYRLCTGVLPFQGPDMISTLMALATQEPRPPREINPRLPQSLSDLVMRLLAKSPAQRPASAQEVVQTIAGLEKGLAGGAAEVTAAPVEAPPAAEQTVPERPGPRVAVTKKRRPARSPRRRAAGSWLPLLLITGGVLGLLALVGAAVVFFWPMPAGVVRITINDPDIQVVFDQKGPTIKGADKTHSITLSPGEHGLVVQRGDLTFETDKFILRKGATVTLKIELVQGKLQVVEDDRVIGAKALPLPLPPTTAAVKGDAFVALFNGKDAKGWFVEKPAAAKWTIENGAIVGRSDNWRNRNYFLTTEKYSDFILCFDFQVDAESHGGVAIRAIEDERAPFSPGNDIFEHPLLKLMNVPGNTKEKTGTTHFLKDSKVSTPPLRNMEVVAGRWQTGEVEVRSDTCRAWLEGKPLVDLALGPGAWRSTGFLPGLARSEGHVGFQVNTGTLRFRNVRIKELPSPH